MSPSAFPFRILLGVSLLCAALRAAEPAPLGLQGTITNTTMNIAAQARMELVFEGEKVTGRLVTEKPLVGTCAVTGRFADGWLEITGQSPEGMILIFRGTLSPRDYRGTYVAQIPNQLAQHGRFTLLRAKP